MKAEMYYNRTIKPELESLIMGEYSWLIDEVYSHDELDFQIGSNISKTWFSIYRGTGRILSICPNGVVDAAVAYKKIFPDFYKNPNKKNFDILLERINKDSFFGRNYINARGEKNEGYYQNLISKRYSLNCKSEDNLLIIDKECVLGYANQNVKERRLKSIRDKYDSLIRDIKSKYPTWSKNFEQTGEEFDFVAITKNGDILVLELKSNNATKTYLSPLQAGKYEDIIRMYMDEFYEDFNRAVHEMIEQKKRMNIIKPAWNIPEKLSGRIKTSVIVGGSASKEVKERYKIVRSIVGKDIPYYECEEDGTLKLVF